MPSIDFPDFWVPFGLKRVRRVNPDSDAAHAFQVYEPDNKRWVMCVDPGARPWREAPNPENTAAAPRTMGMVELMRWLYDNGRVLVSADGRAELRYHRDYGYQFRRASCHTWSPVHLALWSRERLVPEDGEPWGDE